MKHAMSFMTNLGLLLYLIVSGLIYVLTCLRFLALKSFLIIIICSNVVVLKFFVVFVVMFLFAAGKFQSSSVLFFYCCLKRILFDSSTLKHSIVSNDSISGQ